MVNVGMQRLMLIDKIDWIVYGGGNIATTCLNFWWFSQMIAMLRKRFPSKETTKHSQSTLSLPPSPCFPFFKNHLSLFSYLFCFFFCPHFISFAPLWTKKTLYIILYKVIVRNISILMKKYIKRLLSSNLFKVNSKNRFIPVDLVRFSFFLVNHLLFCSTFFFYLLKKKEQGFLRKEKH